MLKGLWTKSWDGTFGDTEQISIKCLVTSMLTRGQQCQDYVKSCIVDESAGFPITISKVHVASIDFQRLKAVLCE